VSSWIVVVPVKGTPAAKSRFGGDAAHRAALAEALALDTVEAVLATLSVSQVIVVTSAVAAASFEALGARVVVDTGDGLNAAIAVGIAAAAVAVVAGGLVAGGVGAAVGDAAAGAGAGAADLAGAAGPVGAAAATGAASGAAGGTAVLLGDLPALQPAELEVALTLALAHARAVVADAAGSGTTLITALRGQSHAPAFGAGSAESHRAAGYSPLDIPAHSGLRRDVDTSDELAAFDAALLGRRTAAAR
jgi:2-phospho-L-lactate guanylyltransferase